MLKHRVHAQLLAFGHACPVGDPFGRRGRELLGRLEFPSAAAAAFAAATAGARDRVDAFLSDEHVRADDDLSTALA